MKTIYGINYPITDRSSDTLNEFFVNKEDAEKAAKGIGWYGSDGTVIPMRLHTSFEEYHAVVEQDKIERAKKKLTPEELELLRREYCGK